MNPPKQYSDPNAYEETLRRLTQLPVPAGLQERVQQLLAAAPRQNQRSWSALFSELFEPQSNWRKGLAAAAILLLIFGVGWGIAWRIQPPMPAAQAAPPVSVTVGGGFSSAGAIRTPQTLQGPAVKAGNDASKPTPASPMNQAADKAKHPALENESIKDLSQAPPSK